MKTFLIYFLIINVLTFFLFGIDKLKAKKNKWRIPEKTLLGFSFFGGAIGGILGMRLFHHKTQKKKFSVGIPIILILHIALFILVLKNTCI